MSPETVILKTGSGGVPNILVRCIFESVTGIVKEILLADHAALFRFGAKTLEARENELCARTVLCTLYLDRIIEILKRRVFSFHG